MFYEEISTKQDFSYISTCSLSILYNSNCILTPTSLGKKCCRCNEGSLYPIYVMQLWHTIFQIIKRIIEEKQEKYQKVYPGLTCFKDGVRQIPVESIPGLQESGWKPPLDKV